MSPPRQRARRRFSLGEPGRRGDPRPPSPRPLLPEWPKLAPRLRRARRRILLCDFDGTLAGMRRSPDAVRLAQATRKLLERIRDDGSIVGVVSGRDLDDVAARVGIPGLWYVGGHGNQLRSPRGRFTSLVSAADRSRVARAARWLRPRLAPLAGIRLDVKQSSVAIHHRAATPPARRSAREIVRAVGRNVPGLRLLEGKKVWDLLPEAAADKWTAVQHLLGQQPPLRPRFLAYLGDDLTDESVFRGMREGITAFVGRPRPSAARYSLRSLSEVRRFLRLWLHAARP